MNQAPSDPKPPLDYIQWFRNSAPYINTHRDNTFVIMFGGEAIQDDNFQRLIHDFSLLHSLGIKIVLVHGSRPQIEKKLQNVDINTTFYNQIRITPRQAMPYILEATGGIRLQLEAQLSMGLVNSPMYGSRIDVVSGNFVSARPYGVHDGVDYQMTGSVRSIDADAINRNLNHNHIVLLGSTGHSITGEVFNLLAEDVAMNVAVSLKADKLIFLGEAEGIHDGKRLLSSLTPKEVKPFLKNHSLTSEMNGFLYYASRACLQGVYRSHIISYTKNGAILSELFTRDGSGTMISHDPYEEIRRATIDDVLGLLALLKPLEQQGILIPRSQERLEQEITHYSIIERDGMVLGCASLYQLDDHSAEIASVAIHPRYRKGNRGADLLAFLQQQARDCGLNKVYVLTTHTTHWFVEQGFVEVGVDHLPISRREQYENGRNSKVLEMIL